MRIYFKLNGGQMGLKRGPLFNTHWRLAVNQLPSTGPATFFLRMHSSLWSAFLYISFFLQLTVDIVDNRG